MSKSHTTYRHDHHGFTLVELLVVITIISTLIGLLLPAVQAAREASRRATCLNNQKQITLAAMTFESSKRSFPGYYAKIGSDRNTGNAVMGSWPVLLFPYIEQRELYDLLASGDSNTKAIKLLVCPSDVPTDGNYDGALSYVANRGVNHRAKQSATGIYNDDYAAHGVFMDHVNPHIYNDALADWSRQLVRVSLDYIGSHDGASNTLLVAESLLGESDPRNPMYLKEYGAYPDSLTYRTKPRWDCKWQDEDAQVNLCFEWGPPSWSSTSLARPVSLRDKIQSNHPGGVVASFCDGHQQFIRADIDRDAFVHVMTPCNSRCPKVSTQNGDPNPDPASGVMDEASL